MAAPDEGRVSPTLYREQLRALWPLLVRVEFAHPLQGTTEGAVAAPGEGRVDPPSRGRGYCGRP